MAELTAVELTLSDGPRTWDLVTRQIDALIHWWESGDTPAPLADFVPDGSPALRRIALVELVKVDLDFRWSRGLRKLVEGYVAEFPELNGPGGVPCDLIYEEYRVRRKYGSPASVEEYVRRFPAQADALRGMHDVPVSNPPPRGKTGNPSEVVAGQKLDDFDLLALVGEGAFARVFLARQQSMQRLVALKVSADQGEEPQTLAQLDHPHIVRVYDQRVTADRGLRLLYMPYLPGGTLREIIPLVKSIPAAERSGKLLLSAVDAALARRGEVPPVDSAERARIAAMSWPEAVCRLGAQLADALEYAHRKGVLHRDLKPANVLLGADATPRLADFNVSTCSKIDGAGPEAFFGGSIAYMSPEQIEAFNPAHSRSVDSLDGRADIYALAITLWELLTGARPFPDEPVTGDWPKTFAAMVARRSAGLDRATVALLPGDMLPGFLDVLAKCLQPLADHRYATAGELSRALDLCRKPRTRELLTFTPGWRTWVIRHAAFSVLAACVLLNMFASWFSIQYNRTAIVEPYPAARKTFQLLQVIVNGTFFPMCVALLATYIWPATKVLRRTKKNRPTGAELVRLRNRCLRFGHASVLVSFWAWALSGVIFPVTLHLTVQSLPLAFHAHFMASQIICGLIAVSYPQFVVTFFVYRCFYPALMPDEGLTADDVARLRSTDRAQNFYLILVASVPMLAVGLLAGIGGENRTVLGVLSAVGVAGFVATSLLTAAIRSDRAALEELQEI
ncbi:MAG TPA: serine/threonine-protein kinase [Fimbriiglobus sp.]